MIAFMIALYRAIPVRPHCDARAGNHVWGCRTLGLAPDWCKDLPGPIPD